MSRCLLLSKAESGFEDLGELLQSVSHVSGMRETLIWTRSPCYDLRLPQRVDMQIKAVCLGHTSSGNCL